MSAKLDRQPAPDFHLPDQTGVSRSLADFNGSWLVLYFYPKDDTPGCTTEACNFRDANQALADLSGAQVVGVSTDSVDSHQKFAKKHGLNFPLLSDPKHQTIEAYHSWQPQTLFGKDLFGTRRNTFLIDPKGLIVKRYEGVNPSSHIKQILDDLARLSVS